MKLNKESKLYKDIIEYRINYDGGVSYLPYDIEIDEDGYITVTLNDGGCYVFSYKEIYISQIYSQKASDPVNSEPEPKSSFEGEMRILEDYIPRIFDRQDTFKYHAGFSYDIRDANVDRIIYDNVKDLIRKIRK